MKKLFLLAHLLFSVALVSWAGLAEDQAISGVDGKAILEGDFNLFETLSCEAYQENAEYSTNGSPDQPKSTKASKISQSRRHTGRRSESYSAPRSGSFRPGTLGGGRGTPTPSNNFQASQQGKPPLRMSHRDRYFGLGSREFGFNFGTAHGFTDLQGSKDMGFGESLNFQVKNPGFTIGVYTRLRMVDWFGLSVGLEYGRIQGEENGTLENYQGFSFENSMVEFNARLAFYAPLSSKNVFDIYGFAGLALFNNSLSLFDAEGFPVEPQGDFKNLQPAIPFGLGFSWLVGQRVVLGYELGYRYTTFNFLDGLAPVDSRYDAYLFTNFKIGFILNPPGN